MPDSLHTVNKDSLVHLSTPFSPCHCNQVRDTGHGLSSLIVKFLIFFFFFSFRLGNRSWYPKTYFFFLPLFCDFTCNRLGHPPITCQHLSIFCFDYCQKFFFRIFNSFSPDILIFTLLGNYIWLLNFLVNPSCTATDEYCHTLIQLGKFWIQLFSLQLWVNSTAD